MRQLERVGERLSELYDTLMRKQIGEEGWDLRDEVLELRSIVVVLAEAVEVLAAAQQEQDHAQP